MPEEEQRLDQVYKEISDMFSYLTLPLKELKMKWSLKENGTIKIVKTGKDGASFHMYFGRMLRRFGKQMWIQGHIAGLKAQAAQSEKLLNADMEATFGPEEVSSEQQ